MTLRSRHGEGLNPLRVQASWINDSEFIGYFVAMAEGYYADVGLAIEHYSGHAGLVPERTLLDRTADIALTSPDSLAATIADTGAEFKIIGAQFQKNPLGLVSLASNPINALSGLADLRLAIPAMNRDMVLDLLVENGSDPAAMTIVPYAHDVAPLASGDIDGFVDFIVDGQFKLRQLGLETQAILLFDHGAPLFNNVVVVRADDAKARRSDLAAWLAASRKGWDENARDTTHYPQALRQDWLDASRSLEQEIFANAIFSALVACPEGSFAMTDAAIAQNLAYLKRLGLPIDPSVFDPSLLPVAGGGHKNA